MKPAKNPRKGLGRVCLGCLWAGLVLFCFRNRNALTPEMLAAYSPSDPVLASALLLGLFGVKSLSVVIYSGLLYAASGILFPLPWAVAVNLCGTVIMVSLPYWIGRKTGGQKAEEIVKKYPRAAELRRLRSESDVLFAFLVRVIGRLPSDVVSLYMGAIKMPYLRYLLGSVLGLLPHTVTFPLISAGLLREDAPGFAWAIAAEVLYVAVAAGACALCQKNKKPHQGKTGGSV